MELFEKNQLKREGMLDLIERIQSYSVRMGVIDEYEILCAEMKAAEDAEAALPCDATDTLDALAEEAVDAMQPECINADRLDAVTFNAAGE